MTLAGRKHHGHESGASCSAGNDELDLVISIGSLGNHEVLARCLSTVFDGCGTDLKFEVWVVFNGDDERPLVGLLEQQFPAVRLFVSPGGPLGYCRTQNVALERARALRACAG